MNVATRRRERHRDTVYFQQAPRLCSLNLSCSEQAPCLPGSVAHLIIYPTRSLTLQQLGFSEGSWAGSWTCPPWVVIQKEKLTWQSPAAAVSVSLPRVGGGGGGSKQTSPTGPFPPPYTAGASCTGSKTGDSKVRWSFHTLSHKDQGTGRRKWLSFSLLPYPQTWSLISSQLLSEKQMLSSEMFEDKSGSSPSAGAEVQ